MIFWLGRANPLDCCPVQRERVFISPHSCFAWADMHVLKTLVNNQIFWFFFFFSISGILKCFLSSVAHFTSLEIGEKNLPTATWQIRGRPQVMLLSFEWRIHHMLGISTNTDVKLPILRLGFYLDVKVNCKFAIIFHSPWIWDIEIASGFMTGTHTGTKHSKNKDWKTTKKWLQWLVSVRLFQIMLIDLLFRAVVMKCSPFLIVEIEFMYIFIFF